MQLAIVQCFEIGMHMLIPFDIIGLGLGAGIQFLICRKAKHKFSRWLFVVTNLIGMLVSDIAAQCITGWDLLVPLFIYWLFFMTFLGSCGCMFVLRLIQNR